MDRDALLSWFATAGRDLPWRATRDPWAVLVSEVMAQQTQVERVIPAWRTFLDRHPSPAALAETPLAEVLVGWKGLGYPRRARALHETATIVAQRGTWPDDLAGLVALPGIGPYTARAVLAFAFERDVAVLDTNVARVVARQAGSRLTPRSAQAAADALVPAGQGWGWNQAMLDLGALVCRPRTPGCASCPVAISCVWWSAGRPDPDPAIGTAGASGRQARFEGSDRQGRGRLLAALGRGEVADADIATVMGWPDDAERAARVARTLAADGLAQTDGTVWTLPR